MARCVVFIDGNNLFHSAKQLGLELDYGRLLAHLVEGRELVRAIFYTGVDEGAERQRAFLHWLRRNGFRVVQKAVKAERDGTRRARLEVEIATDLLAAAGAMDVAVLVSGDEDFAYPLQALAQKGVRVEVAGFRAAMASRVLDAADRFHELDAATEKIRKDSTPTDDEFRERL
jgi:uncharacterized LabA/DUF88 family protein